MHHNMRQTMYISHFYQDLSFFHEHAHKGIMATDKHTITLLFWNTISSLKVSLYNHFNTSFMQNKASRSDITSHKIHEIQKLIKHKKHNGSNMRRSLLIFSRLERIKHIHLKRTLI